MDFGVFSLTSMVITHLVVDDYVLKSSQVNTLPKAKSQAKDKRAKDRQ
jgi:hypothetical protein